MYRRAGIEKRGETWLIVLGGKAAQTPRGAPLEVPARSLAEAIAMEWSRQGERLDPADMDLTALANSAIDRATPHRGEVAAHLLGFGRSDLVCYRAGEPELAVRQAAIWDPLLAWAEAEHGIRLTTARGIVFVEQSVGAFQRMQEILARLDGFFLAAFDAAASLTGSYLLALALISRRLNAEDTFTAAQLDELYQAEKWGRDAAAEFRRQRILEELKTVERFVSLLSSQN